MSQPTIPKSEMATERRRHHPRRVEIRALPAVLERRVIAFSVITGSGIKLRDSVIPFVDRRARR